jgi:hypothetical protein
MVSKLTFLRKLLACCGGLGVAIGYPVFIVAGMIGTTCVACAAFAEMFVSLCVICWAVGNGPCEPSATNEIDTGRLPAGAYRLRWS